MDIVLSREIEAACAIPVTYDKGTELFEAGAVEELKLEKESGRAVRLHGYVRGMAKEGYHINIKMVSDDVSHYLHVKTATCECKAFSSYNGYCKHIVATLMHFNLCSNREWIKDLLKSGADGEQHDLLGEYCYGKYDYTLYDDKPDEDAEVLAALEQVARSLLPDDDAEEYDGIVHRTASGRTFGTPAFGTMAQAGQRESSSELLSAMSGIVFQERNQFCQELSGGDVQLEATLHLNRDEEKLELRIGRKQFYVVKNISGLLQAIRKQEYVSYGKKLEFVHSQSAFTKEALELITLLLNNPVFHSQSERTGYYYTRPKDQRYCQLSANMLEEILKQYEGKSIFVKTVFDDKKRLVPVKRENPSLPVKLKGIDVGRKVQVTFPGIILLEGSHWFAIYWNNCIYLCDEEYCRNMRELIEIMAINDTRRERAEHADMYYFHVGKPEPQYTLCEKDYPSFCSTLLPLLEEYTSLTVKNIDFSKYQIEEGRFEVYLDLKKNQKVVCEAVGIYGDRKCNIIKTATLHETYRDVRTEYDLRMLLEQYFTEKTEEQYVLEGDDERLAALVEHGVESLRSFCDVYVSDAFKKIRIASDISFHTGFSIRGNLLSVNWDIGGMSNEELYDILKAYKKKRKYYRLQNGELLNLSESGLSVLAQMQEDLHLSKAELKAGMTEVPMYRALYLNALMKENADRITISRDEMFDRMIQGYEEMKEKRYTVPETVQAKLRTYQKQGYDWACALSDMGFGGILADDMGLGKTLQMITYLSSQQGMTHLVICPASLVYNWEAEFARFAPSMRVCAVVGAVGERQEMLANWKKFDVLVTSYDLLKRDVEFYTEKQFGCQIIDEAQYIKNPGTQAAKAVKAIQSRNRFALTGTPIENRLSELWSIFEYLMPGYLYSYKYFKETFEEQIVQETEGGESTLKRLHQMIAPFLLRRLKKDVLKDLPDKIEKVVYSRFEKEQDKLYKATEKNLLMSLKKKSGREIQESKLQILAELTRLRQICCNPALVYEDYKAESAKLNTCMEVVESAIEGGHRILLFSQFTSMLDILAKELQKRDIRYFTLTGSTTKSKRRDLVDKFQNGKAQVFLISLKAGGTGLNLTAADMVIHYDPWWNVAAQNQATDRTHRIGQKNTVTVVKLIAKDTIEERILKLQEKKQDLADKIISAEGVSLSALSKDELLELFE